jgi:PAS domain S-box-containing protein
MGARYRDDAIGDRLTGDRAAQHYAAIVEYSDDAILSKDLNGVIMTWNRGAQRLFGYTAEETIGRPVTILIPPDRYDEEPMILARIRSGERIEQYETVRRRKDGSLVDISLSVSPIRDRDGNIVGASKIARDISERKRAQERQELLLREMEHRVKNLFALAISVVSLSARSAKSVEQLVETVRERLSALARAHALTLPHALSDAPQEAKPATLHSLIRAIVAAHEDIDGANPRFGIVGCDIPISGPALSSIALLLHEFTTNAAKYCALSTPKGRVEILCADQQDLVVITWTERGGPAAAPPPDMEGFGSVLTRATVAGQLGGRSPRNGLRKDS